MVFDVPKETLLKRDAARERSVGKDVIEKMWKQWLILKDSFDFQPVNKDKYKKVIVPDIYAKNPAVIFDIDGTLAYCNTNKANERGYFEWDKVYKDDVFQIVAELTTFHKLKGRDVIVVTGRDESCRKITEDWLELNGISYDKLYMRPKDNYEKDSIIKTRIYNELIKPENTVLAVFDDRKQTCAAWNKLGLYVFSCNQGDKLF